MTTAGYYRFPTIHNDTIVFVSEDDLWSVSREGGLARRLTSNLGDVTYPMLSPDGEWLAFVGREEGAPEVYVMPAGGGSAVRLTYLSSYCRIVGWDPTGEYILFASNYGQVVHSEYSLYRVALSARNGTVDPLPYGPARSIAFGPNGEIVLGRNTGDPARWKRYRGGTAGHMWIGKEGEFGPFLAELPGNIAAPMWISTPSQSTPSPSVNRGERIFFVSDHQGIGNLYSSAPDGSDLRRHTDHEDYYVRNPSTDGKRIVYHAGADLYVYDVATDRTTCLDVDYRSPRVQRNRKFVSSRRYLGDAVLHPSGQVTTLITRGKAYTFFNHEGPVLQHGVPNGVRYRLPLWFNDGRRMLMVSDEPGEETLEIHSAEPGVKPLQLLGLDIGRPVAMKMCPTADRVAISNHRHELLLIDLDGLDVGAPAAPPVLYKNGASHSDDAPADPQHSTEPEPDYADRVTLVDRSPQRLIRGFDWSPDGRWLAYGFGATTHTTAIRLYRLADPDATEEALRTASIHTITQPVLHDMQPAFDPDGRFLYFLSSRDFNPVYDAMHFDLSFPWGMRPYLITLQADQPNPFIPRPDADEDWPDEGPEEEEDEEEEGQEEGEDELEEEGDDEEGEGDADEDALDDDLEDADIDGDEADDIDAVGGRAGAKEDPAHLQEANVASAANGKAATPNGEAEEPAGPPALRIDLEGIERRVLAFPVPDARYGQIAGIPGKALFTVLPVEGALDIDEEWDDEDEESGSLRAYDFKELKTETIANEVSWFTLSRNGKRLLYFSGRYPRIIKAGEKAPSSSGNPRKTGWIHLGRIKVSVDPPSEWQQMMREAWRLQRDYFWTEDMSQVDWQTVFLRYYPLIERVSSRSEFSDLMWEMQGELATSHAYEYGGDYRSGPYYSQGFLGADLRWDGERGGYVIGEPLRGDSWDRAANSPLSDPGLDVRPGDVVVAINGQPLDAETGPAQLLVNQANSEIMLTLLPRPEDTAPDEAGGARAPTRSQTSSQTKGGETKAKKPAEQDAAAAQDVPPPPLLDSSQYRMVVVKTVHSETPARYRAWVEANRQRVHAATEGRVGYVHIPDMGATGYAEFHRGYLAETDREGLIVDVRYNGGGHVSQLILEKLARRRIGYDMSRWSSPIPYPMDSVAGPIVALTNEHASSDGDIFCHGFKLMGLGPLIGKRTWGGVIGISPRQTLVDGTITTQPEYSFWFEDVGWGVENYGTDPDIDVDITPQDYAAGRDPQLERSIAEAMRLLSTAVILKPDLNNRPRLPLPKLPPRV